MAVEIKQQGKRKEELMKTFKSYDHQRVMFKQCAIRMLNDQQSIIHKQWEKLEKNKEKLKNLKEKLSKTTKELKEKSKQPRKLKTPKTNCQILCPVCKKKKLDKNNKTNYNRHVTKCKAVEAEKKAKEEKKMKDKK